MANGLFSDSDLLIRSAIKVPSDQSSSPTQTFISQESTSKLSTLHPSNPQDYFSAFDANLKQVKKEARKTIKEMNKT